MPLTDNEWTLVNNWKAVVKRWAEGDQVMAPPANDPIATRQDIEVLCRALEEVDPTPIELSDDMMERLKAGQKLTLPGRIVLSYTHK